MKRITFYLVAFFLAAFSWQGMAQSTINITTSGGSYGTEKWVSITTGVDGSGTQVWGQGDGTYGNAPGYINEDIAIAPGTYYVNCYDKYADGWDGTLISVTAYGAVLNDNGGASPDDGTDDDAGSTFGDTQAQELEASLQIIVPNPPSCSPPTGLVVDSMTDPSNGSFSWDAVAGAASYNFEIQPQGVAQGTAGVVASGSSTNTSFNATSLVDGTDYTLYVQTDCGGGDSSTYASLDFSFIIPPVNDTMAGATPITPSPEGTACDAASEFSAHTAGDGTTDSGMDGTCSGSDTGLDVFYSWTATSDALIWNDGDGNPGIVIRDTAGTQITCAPTYAGTDTELSGWAIGDDLIIQIYDFDTADVDVTFCLATKMLPTCPDPSGMAVTNITETTAEFNLTENGSATVWDFEVVESGVAPTGTPTEDDVTLPYTAWTGTQNTDYDVYYRADCGQDNTTDVSNWVGPVSFSTLATPPANDDACNAEMLTLNAAPVVGDTSGSTAQADEPVGSCWMGTSQMNSVWYSFVSNGMDVVVTTDFDTPLNDTHIAIYSATDCADLTTFTEVGCDEDSGNTGTFGWNSIAKLSGLTAGDTYYIQVDGYGTKMDEFNIQLVDNDFMVGAIPIVPSPEGTACDADAATFTAHLAGDGTTDSGMDGSCNGTSTGLDRFFSWTATSIGLVWNDGNAGNPGIVIRDTDGNEITCEGTYADDDVVLSGWAIGDDLIIQIYDYDTADVDVTFCLAEISVFNPEITATPMGVDCTVDASFNVDVDVTTLGGASAVTVSDDQASATQNATATGVLTFGPYAPGTVVTFTVTSDDDATYTSSSEAVSYVCPPANDNICDAIALTVDATSAGDAYTNLGATAEAGEPVGDCFDSGINGSVWFNFVAPASGTVNVTTDIVGGTLTDTEIAVYEAPTDCADAATMGALLGCDQDGGTDVTYNSVVALSGLTAGDTYYIQVDQWGTATSGTFGIEVQEITVSLPDCPTLVSPADGAVDVLSPVVLDWDVAAGGDPADSYNVYFTFNGDGPYFLGNYTDTETPELGLGADGVIVWWVYPVNAAGENTTCTTQFTFSSYIGTDDYDGDGVDNATEVNNGTDMTLPCDPVQAAGYTGYDATNAIWMAADCDGDGQTNDYEATNGSDPYDAASTASLDELATVGFEFYPNPVNNNLTVKANENITSIAIFNMLGQQVKQVNPSSLNAQIDMTNLANGTYFIKATVGEKVGTFKIVKK